MWTHRAIFLAALLIALPVAADEIDIDDDDSGTPAFMIMLKHESGWQCAASLVSLRTAVTTARCARSSGSGELLALAAEFLSAQPPPPIAASARRIVRIALAGNGLDPGDPALDIAVIELEAPFGREVYARPILMATTRGSFDETLECYAIRALPTTVTSAGIKRARFRVVSLSLADEARCTARLPHWTALRPNMLCFSGEELCERDMGGAVVCDGKLSGVLSITAKDDEVKKCGVVFAVQNIVHWRSFLHCSHTLRRCGRDTCKNVCFEHNLLENKLESTDVVSANTKSSQQITHISTSSGASRTAAFSSANDSLDVITDDAVVLQPSAVFEPNRADFMAAPTRTTRPALKAGEYGDNVAEYVVEDAPPASPSRRTAPAPTRSSTPRPAPAVESAMLASPFSSNVPASASEACITPIYHVLVPFYIVLK